MRNYLATSFAALAVGILASGSADAADPFDKGSTKDVVVSDNGGVVNWTGLYVGGSVGYGNANHELTVQDYNGSYCYDQDGNYAGGWNPTDSSSTAVQPTDPTAPNWNDAVSNVPAGGCTGSDTATVEPSSKDVANLDGLNSSGIVGDGRIGFDLARGRLLGGVFASYGFSNMETTASVAGLGNAWIEKGDEWSVGARIGYIVAPRTLAYILAAYTQTEYEFGIAGGGSSASKDVTFDGVTVGGGVEFAVANNIFLGLEGTHTFYGEETLLDSGGSAVGGFGTRLNDELSETKIMGTLKFKLNNGLPF
jgi:outer membrane immunogenic protein